MTLPRKGFEYIRHQRYDSKVITFLSTNSMFVYFVIIYTKIYMLYTSQWKMGVKI